MGRSLGRVPKPYDRHCDMCAVFRFAELRLNKKRCKSAQQCDGWAYSNGRYRNCVARVLNTRFLRERSHHCDGWACRKGGRLKSTIATVTGALYSALRSYDKKKTAAIVRNDATVGPDAMLAKHSDAAYGNSSVSWQLNQFGLPFSCRAPASAFQSILLLLSCASCSSSAVW